MKFGILFFLFSFNASLNALATDFPVLQNLNGIVLQGLTTRQPITLAAGQPVDCKLSSGPGQFSYSKCKLEDSKAYVTGVPGSSLYLDFKKLSVYVHTRQDGQKVYEYEFSGQWSSISHQVPLTSKVWVRLKRFPENPDKYIGMIELSDLALKAPVVAYPQRANID